MPFSLSLGLRWPRALAVLTTLSCISLASLAQAVSFNTQQQQQHQDWESLVVSLGQEQHIRAVERSSYTDAMLSINATPGRCTRHWLEMRSGLGEQQAISDQVNEVPADVLVDENPAMTGRAALSTERGDDGLYLRFHDLDMPLLEAQMSTGQQLHLRIRMSESLDDYWFMTFSLNGANEALSRLRELCQSSR